MNRKIQLFFLSAIFLLVSKISFAQPGIGMTTFTTNTTTTIHANTSCITTKTASLSGWLFSIATTSNCGMNTSNVGGGDGRFQYTVGFGTLTQATFGSDDGSEFALQNLTWGVSTTSWTAKPMLFTGYKNGTAVPGATLMATTPSGTGVLNEQVVTFTGNPYFSDVDNITLAITTGTCNNILFFEDITIGAATPNCPPSLLSFNSSNVRCYGGSSGSATVTPDGTSPFTYTWSPGGSNAASITGLSAGIYTCAVTNGCGASSSQTVEITQPASALVTFTAITNVACNGGSTGVAAIAASGGWGGYTYLWNTGATTSAITGQLAGVYTATVTDANSCTSVRAASVGQPSSLVTTTAVTNVACNGGNNGVAAITASGGAGGYSYLWSNGASTSAITGLLAGVYTATVTDANSCTSVKTASVSQPTSLVTTTAVTNVACNGGNNGVASITASGGAGGYSYLWSNGATTSAITSLLAGVYTATVTDANSCTSIKAASVTQLSALVTSTAVTNVACNGGNNGVASITASGGAGGYSYLWSNGATTSAITGLLAGAYTATVTDANSCTSIKAASVTQPAALTTSTAVTTVLCNGGTGSATITTTGGTGAYSYLWSNGAITSSISGQLAGAYTATVTDANSCTSSKAASITQPAALTTSTAVTTVLCNGGTGSATITATGGTGSYTYLWSNGASTSVITGQLAGAYTATVTDANSCTSSKALSITQPTALSTSTAVTSILCNGGTGSATITATGGTSPYAGAGSFTVTAGTHSYTVTDNNGCVSTTSIVVSEPLALSAASATTAILCNGGSATVTVSGSGGTAPYTGNGTFTVTAGSYSYTVSDNNGCMATTSGNITEPSVLLAHATASSILCHGAATTVTLSATGGTSPYLGEGTYTMTAGTNTYSVTDANGCAATTTISVTEPAALASSQSFTVCAGQSIAVGTNTYAAAGTFTDVIAAINGCDSTVVTELVVNSLPTITVNSGTICAGQSFTFVAGGASTYTYSAGSSTVSPSATDSYTITGTDLNGCENTAISSVVVNNLPAINATSTHTMLCAGETATLSATGATSYTWSTNATTASVAVSPATTTTYTVEGVDGNGCVNSAVVTQDVSLCTGISTMQSIDVSVYAYPNPGKGLFTVHLPAEARIMVINALGKIIINETTSEKNYNLNLNEVADGLYFLTATVNGRSHVVKLIKQQ